MNGLSTYAMTHSHQLRNHILAIGSGNGLVAFRTEARHAYCRLRQPILPVDADAVPQYYRAHGELHPTLSSETEKRMLSFDAEESTQ
jgi:hypothetical protein